MEVKHGEKVFYIGESLEAAMAKMTYVPTGEDKFIIDHTEVSEELRGQGAGQQLVEAAVNFAREKNLKIIPLCPFAKHVFDKNPDFNDVLK